MNGARVRALARKEWLDLKKSRTVLIGMALVPTLLTGVFVSIILLTSSEPLSAQDAAEVRRMLPPALAGMDPRDALTVMLGQQFLMMMLVSPLALPGAIAANSIVGEKVERSLEPLLATPLSTFELIFAKALVAILPAVLITWLGWAIALAMVTAFGRPAVVLAMLSPPWILAMILHVPLFSALSTLAALIASSRTNDPKVAQSWSALLILPVLGLGVTALLAQVLIDVTLLLWSAGALLLVVLGLLRIAVRVFARETILTRWK